uniref:Uncharacterized protein n=1 Tax=Leersia perrieri TaxID=77586 RepID=A0A0D9XU62_9ORYZ
MRSEGMLVPADGEDSILVPHGKLALSRKLVDKILSLERRELPHAADDPTEAAKGLWEGVVQPEEAGQARGVPACQAMIRKLRHGNGYAVLRVAVIKAGGVFVGDADLADLVDEGFSLASK